MTNPANSISPEMADRLVTPETAAGLWGISLWSDERFMEWMRNRSGITEDRAREILEFMKERGDVPSIPTWPVPVTDETLMCAACGNWPVAWVLRFPNSWGFCRTCAAHAEQIMEQGGDPEELLERDDES